MREQPPRAGEGPKKALAAYDSKYWLSDQFTHVGTCLFTVAVFS